MFWCQKCNIDHQLATRRSSTKNTENTKKTTTNSKGCFGADGVIQIRFLSNYPMGEKYNSHGLSNQRDSKSIEEFKPNRF